MDWSKKIKELRYFKCLKQETLAIQLGVSQGSVSKWERGTAIPPSEAQIQLQNMFLDPPEEVTMRSLIISVVNSPGLAALLTLENGSVLLSVLSPKGFSDMPLLTHDDIGKPLLGKLGHETDRNINRLVEAGIFSGDVSFATLESKFERHGQSVHFQSTHTPFKKENGEWVVRTCLTTFPVGANNQTSSQGLIIHKWDNTNSQ